MSYGSFWASQVALVVKNPPAKADGYETQVQSLGREDLLEEGTATHSSILAWRTPRTEEPGGPQSLGSRGVRPDGTTDQAGAHSARRPQLESASNPSQ